MGTEPHISQTKVRVRYAETDQMGVVYHANYFIWFEVGRVELMRQAGLDYRDMEREEGCLVVVVEATARYKSPARYDNELTIHTHIRSVRGSIIRFAYQITYCETLLCEGETTHIVVGRDMKRKPLPEKYAKRFADLAHPME